jgi:hypothetical protein
VLAELNQTGVYLGDGMWQAACPLCRRLLTLPLREWWADHVVAVGSGGHESGMLRLSCAQCQRRQSGKVRGRRVE